MSPPLASGADRPASPDDVVQLYRFVNDREPESEVVIENSVGIPRAYLAAAFFGTDEFAQRVVRNAERGIDIWGVKPGPTDEQLDWACEVLPLTAEGVAGLRAWGASWPGVYFAILSDSGFRSSGSISAVGLSHLKALASAFGGVERLDSALVVGWAMARGPAAGPVVVEVYGDGAFLAAGRADRFRRNVQDQFGGDGLVGFEIPLPRQIGAGPTRIEVRAAPYGRVLGQGEIHVQPAPATGLHALKQEIASVRAMLERLELMLPTVVSGMGRPLADYGDYFEDGYRRPAVVRPDGAGFTIVLDGAGRSTESLFWAATSLESQMTASDRLVLVVDSTLENSAADIAARSRGRGRSNTVVLASPAADPGQRAREALASESNTPFVLLTDSDAVLSGRALAEFAATFARSDSVQALYADEDAFDPEDGRERPSQRHFAPILRSGFDLDLLRQLPYVGTVLAFRSGALDAAGLLEECGGLHGCDALLRIGTAPGAVGHVASVLGTRSGPAVNDGDGTIWARCVTRHLAEHAPQAAVQPRDDALGTVVPGAVRVRFPAGDVRVSVIIPTRDRLDLLKPCIDSILAHRSANRCALELIVIDHESCEPGTRAYLDPLAAAGDISILPFKGAFNWALMNNLAADKATGEVLVFLNNDTVVVSPDWLDEMASQALRPEVGVVGCRLIYADGTIQHAGFVSRGHAPDFLIHDGVGVAGSDGGYLGRHALLHASPVVTGACMAIRAPLFRSLGGFDSANFPLEGNDADLCYRVRAEGLSVLYDPYATLYHLESKTRGFSVSGEDRTASLAAQALLRQRWGDRFGEDAGFNPHFDRTGRPFERLRPPPGD
jgi:GT2 family glycosyltransferase